MTNTTKVQILAPSQLIIRTEKGAYLQSCNSIIAFCGNDNKIELDKTYWDYSKTTGKYRNMFLQEDKKATEKKLASGEYTLTNLN